MKSFQRPFFSLLLIQEGLLSVTHEVLVNRPVHFEKVWLGDELNILTWLYMLTGTYRTKPNKPIA